MPWGRPDEEPDQEPGPFSRDVQGEGAGPPSWSQDDDADLAALLAEHDRAARRLDDRIWVQLVFLMARKVPVRGMERGPVEGVGRLRWADGTVLLVRPGRPGELGRVVRGMGARRSLVLQECDETDDGAPLLLLGGAPGKEPVRLVVIGPDQPD